VRATFAARFWQGAAPRIEVPPLAALWQPKSPSKSTSSFTTPEPDGL